MHDCPPSDSLFSNVSYFLGIVSFVVLRFTKPDMPRPFLALGGKSGAVALAAPQLAVIIASFVSLGLSRELVALDGVGRQQRGRACSW
jgi:hypothetical protein